MRWGGWWGRRGKEEEGKEAVAARISRIFFGGGVWAGWVMGDGWMGWVSVCDGWKGLWLDHLGGGRRRSESLCLPLLLLTHLFQLGRFTQLRRSLTGYHRYRKKTDKVLSLVAQSPGKETINKNTAKESNQSNTKSNIGNWKRQMGQKKKKKAKI